MGKSAKIRQLRKLRKEQGLPKPYIGKGRVAKEYFHKDLLEWQLYFLKLKPGDVVHDCDGFNHSFTGERLDRLYSVNRSTTISVIEQIVFSDGRYSCGCCQGWPWERIPSREVIEARAFAWYTHQSAIKCGWIGEAEKARAQALSNGGHICDEHGILLDKFVKTNE